MKSISKEKAWNIFAEEFFGAGTDATKKDRPRNAYLDLCEDVLVDGVTQGNYVSIGNLEKLYAAKPFARISVFLRAHF